MIVDRPPVTDPVDPSSVLGAARSSSRPFTARSLTRLTAAVRLASSHRGGRVSSRQGMSRCLAARQLSSSSDSETDDDDDDDDDSSSSSSSV